MYLNMLIKSKNILIYSRAILYLAKCSTLRCTRAAFIVANISVVNTQYVFRYDRTKLNFIAGYILNLFIVVSIKNS